MSELRNEYRSALNRLRQLRERAGLTLKRVEELSQGRWKAGAVGSYERGTRILTLERAIELLDFYGAQISALAPSLKGDKPRIVIDLRNLRKTDSSDALTLAIRNLTRSIKLVRGDWNAQLISLRNSDIENPRSVTGFLNKSLIATLELRDLLISVKDQ